MNGERIKIAIKSSGKTQEEIAEIIGISREYLGKLLKGNVPEIYVEKITTENYIKSFHSEESDKAMTEIFKETF